MRKLRPAREMTHQSYAQEAHNMIEKDMPIVIPAEWHSIWRERDRRDAKKTRVSLTLDADVVRFFKAMGAGYQPRINRVLRAFMHDRLAGLVDGPEVDREAIKANMQEILDEIAHAELMKKLADIEKEI